MSEEVLNEGNWKKEAQAVIDDIKEHVKSAEIAKNPQGDDRKVFINLKTLEDEDYCIELSGNGFRYVGRSFDDASLHGGEYFETPYSLLSKISPSFHRSFGGALINKLNALN